MSHFQIITAERNKEMTNDCVHINLQEYYKGQVQNKMDQFNHFKMSM